MLPVPARVPPQLPVYQRHVAPVVSTPFTVSVELVPKQIPLDVALMPVGSFGCVVTVIATPLLDADVPQLLVEVAE